LRAKTQTNGKVVTNVWMTKMNARDFVRPRVKSRLTERERERERDGQTEP
jgi:hypothetical protein